MDLGRPRHDDPHGFDSVTGFRYKPTSQAVPVRDARRLEDVMRVSRDWWAVVAAAAAIILIKTGLVVGIPW